MACPIPTEDQGPGIPFKLVVRQDFAWLRRPIVSCVRCCAEADEADQSQRIQRKLQSRIRLILTVDGRDTIHSQPLNG